MSLVAVLSSGCGSGDPSAGGDAQGPRRAATAGGSTGGSSSGGATGGGGAPFVAPGAGPTSRPGDAGAAPAPAGDAGGLLDITHGACCAAHATPGCDDPTLRHCVCAVDPRCCTGLWNAECVALVGGLGCGVCKTDCCAASASAGCADPALEACVCGKSKECCSAAWDDFCVALVGAKAGGSACGHCP